MIHAVARYRADDGRWRHGTTKCISRSSLLLQAPEALTPNTNVEIVVELPVVMAGERAARLECRGHVERTLEATAVSDAIIALSLSHCWFGRRDEGSEQDQSTPKASSTLPDRNPNTP